MFPALPYPPMGRKEFVMSVKVKIVATYVKEVVVEHTNDFGEAKEYVMNNSNKFPIDLDEDFFDCEYIEE